MVAIVCSGWRVYLCALHPTRTNGFCLTIPYICTTMHPYLTTKDKTYVIYQAAEGFSIRIERAGLTQVEIAERAEVNRYHLAHIAAGRRNVGGAYATRIASVYAAQMQLSLDEALACLFTIVREQKSTTGRHRDATGRFVKDTTSLESLHQDVDAHEVLPNGYADS